MYRQTLGGFWSTIFKGSLQAGKVALATATGGPQAGAMQAAAEIGQAVKGTPGGGAGGGAAVAQSSNFLAGMNNTQLAFLTIGSAAVVIGLAGRRR